MRFEVLGPLQVHGHDGAIRIPPGHTYRVLGVLLSRANEYVSVPDLIDAQWPDSPPPSAKQNTRRSIHWLRTSFGDPSRISYGHSAYALRLDPGELDAHDFATLLGQAKIAERGDQPGEAVGLFDQALRLWRGKPYVGLEDCQLLLPEIQRLTKMQLRAVEGWATGKLALGEHADLIPELAGLVEADPRQERLVGLYMRALYASGRHAEAQDAFWRTKDRLADELGADPTPELRQLYEAILRGKLELPRVQPELHVPTAKLVTVPRQLPVDVYGFVGRDTELEQLDALLATDDGQPTAVVVSGTAGVGKTSLAVHWAHRVAGRFPDGQLYVNLRGFDPTGSVVEAAGAVRGFLDALGVAPGRIPVDLDPQAALYRSLLAGKRILVVLDNARDTDQIRPLLPGSSGCLALVTSRNDLVGLVIKEGAQPLTLDLLTDAEARQLLEQRLGTKRAAAEPEAVDDILAVCAGLPLALAIVAARTVAHPRFSLRTMTGDLSKMCVGLDAFSVDDPSADVRTVFSWSYQQLTPDAARLFRFLSIHPGPDISAQAAVSLTALPPEDIRSLLAELTRANLVTQTVAKRYTFHDLLRAYAGELAQHTDTDEERHTVMHRLLDHYLCAAYAANRLISPRREPITLALPCSGVTPEHFDDHDEAMRWFTSEHTVLLACLDRATDGFETYSWQLAWALYTFLYRRGHWHDLAAALHAALKATHRLGHQAAHAKACSLLAIADVRLGRFDDAHTHLQHALALYRELDDQIGQANIQHNLGWVCGQQRRHTEALAHNTLALTLFQKAGHRQGEANVLGEIGWDHAQLGHHQQALDTCRRAHAMFQELDDRYAAADAWACLGYVHHHLCEYSKAIDCYQNALTVFRDHSDRYYEADTLRRLGETQQGAGDTTAARRTWQQALTIYEELDHPDADGVRTKLEDLGQADS